MVIFLFLPLSLPPPSLLALPLSPQRFAPPLFAQACARACFLPIVHLRAVMYRAPLATASTTSLSHCADHLDRFVVDDPSFMIENIKPFTIEKAIAAPGRSQRVPSDRFHESFRCYRFAHAGSFPSHSWLYLGRLFVIASINPGRHHPRLRVFCFP